MEEWVVAEIDRGSIIRDLLSKSSCPAVLVCGVVTVARRKKLSTLFIE